MKRIKTIFIIILFSIAVLNYEKVNAQSTSDIEYDVYELAESGMLIKFPKNPANKTRQQSDENKKSILRNSSEEGIGIAYDVFELAESGRLIKFPKKPTSHAKQSSREDKISSLDWKINESPELEYDVYELAESGMLIKFPHKKIKRDIIFPLI